MTVATEPLEVRSETKPALGLAGASLVGTLYIAGGFLLVYHGVPWFWDNLVAATVELGGFIGQGLRLALMAAVAAGLVYMWPRLLRPQPGLRAGVTFGVLSLLGGLLLVYLAAAIAEAIAPWLFSWFMRDPEDFLEQQGFMVGAVAAFLAAFFWTRYIFRTFRKETFHGRMRNFEEQGWLTVAPYKKGQGLRARRGTILGILIVVGCGLWVYTQGRQIGYGAVWAWTLPFDASRQIPILRSPGITMPVIIALLAGWLAFRLVNYPHFADFLIATEGEMNKVSWTSQKRLVQDTIVVLVTVLLMAVFLFLVDVVWTFVLQDILHVIQTPPEK